MTLALKVPPVVQLLLCALLMYAVAQYLPGMGVPTPLAWALGLVCLAGGIGIGALGVRRFNHHKTTVDPRIPHQTSALVTGGIYRHTRNPMYVGLALALFGWGWALDSALSWGLIPVWMVYLTRFQIKPEEDALATRFGRPYLEYCQRVRRWL